MSVYVEQPLAKPVGLLNNILWASGSGAMSHKRVYPTWVIFQAIKALSCGPSATGCLHSVLQQCGATGCYKTVLMFLSKVLLLLLLLACRSESRGLWLGAGSRTGQVWRQGPAPPSSCLDVEDAEVLQVNSAGPAV